MTKLLHRAEHLDLSHQGSLARSRDGDPLIPGAVCTSVSLPPQRSIRANSELLQPLKGTSTVDE